MKLAILGSCGGYPEPGRACSGYLVQSPSTSVWVDAGAGTLDALLRILSLESLDGILISHLHPDHWTDLPIALHRLAVTSDGKLQTPVPVYGPADWPLKTGVADQWFARDQSVFVPYELQPDGRIALGDLEVRLAAVDHGMPAFAMRFSDGLASLAYSADSAPCDALVDIARGTNLFLCEATLPAGSETAISMNPEQVGRLAAIAGVERLLLTHLLPGISPEESCAVAGRWFGGPVEHARPGTTFEVRR